MRTDDLIRDLSADLPPVAPGAPVRRVVGGLGAGALASSVLMLAWLGVRPDLVQALGTGMFWIKLIYAVLAGLVLAAALLRLSRPGARLGGLGLLVATPFALMAAMAAARLAMADPAERMPLLMGGSADVCPWRIFVIGLPILAGAVWAVRGLAPTRLALAGLAAGGCAGAIAAAIYGFHCDETAGPFVAVWYTLGMAAVAAAGGLAGKPLLRWR